MIKTLSICLAAFISAAIHAQTMPDTELWLFTVSTSKTGPVLTKSVNISKRAGYDNQPSFSPDSKKIFYVSVRDDQQADIYTYDVKRKKNSAFTKTTISEFSPVLAPGGKFLSSVVVESDSSQFIHFINPLTGIHETKLNVDSVGYCTFLTSDTLVYYKLTNPHSLRYHIQSTGEDKWLANLPTRAFKALDKNIILYGLKDSASVSFYKYNFLLHKGEKYAEYPSLNEDFIWNGTFGLIKSEGLQLLRFDEATKSWQLLFDLSNSGLKKITRFELDPKNNYLVVTDNP